MADSTYTRRVTIYINGIEVENNIKVVRGEMAKLTAQQAKMTIGSKEYNKTGAEIKKLDAIMKQHRQSINSMGGAWGTIKGFLPIASITGAAYAIKSFFTSSVEGYREQERAVQKVDQALKQTGNTAGLTLKQLTDEATRLQENTIFGDEQILNDATAQLLTFTNIAGDNFLKAQQAALDLSTVLDGDLQSASIQLGKALNDPVQGLTALRRSGVTFSKDQIAVIKNLQETNQLGKAQALILEEINRQYGGQAEAVAKGAGAFKQAKNALGEIGETVGGFLANAITPLALRIKEAAISFNEFISVPVSEKMEEERISVNSLALQLFDANLKAEDRRKILVELNRMAPQVTKNLDAEALSYDQLEKNLAAYNEEMINKIVLQTKDQEISDQNEEIAKTRLKRVDFEIKLREKLIKTNEWIQELSVSENKLNKITLEDAKKAQDALYDENLSLEEKSNLLANIIFLDSQYFEGARARANQITTDLLELNKVKEKENELTGKSNKLLQARQELASQLGIGTEAATPDIPYAPTTNEDETETTNETFTAPYVGAVSDEEWEQVNEDIEKYLNLTDEQIEAELAAYADKVDKEIMLEVDKYAKLEDQREKDKQDQLDTYNEMASKAEELASYSAGILIKFLEDGKLTSQEFLKLITLTALRALKNSLIAGIAESTIKSIATYGPIMGGIRAGISIALIETAYQGVEALMMRNTKQAAHGRYPVIGADDGHAYSADYYGPVSHSGIINHGRPTLINERGGEMILTAQHTNNIARLNPALFDTIMAYRAPQRAEGNYVATATAQAGTDNTQLMQVIAQNTAAMQQITAAAQNLKAKVVLSEFETQQTKLDKIRGYATGTP